MNAFTETRAFWWLVAILVYPVLFAGFIGIVIMPPLNMIGVPIWFFVAAGAVGGISNGFERAARRREAQREARRYAPGVVPVQRTNAL